MTSRRGPQRACSLGLLVVLLSVLLSLSSLVSATAGLTYEEFSFADDYDGSISGSSKFILGWDATSDPTSSSDFEYSLFLDYTGDAHNDPLLITGITSATFSSEDCTFTAQFDSSDRGITLSFQCSEVFPSDSNYVTLVMTLNKDVPCDTVAQYTVSGGEGDVLYSSSVTFHGKLCPVSFADVTLTSALVQGVPQVTVGWSGVSMSVHTHKVFNPMLILKNTGGAKIFDSDTGESTDVTGSDGVTVWAEISDDNIMIEFDIPEDKSLSTTTAGSFIVPVKAIGMCSKSTVGDYKLESDSDVTAVSSEPTVTVTLAECPQITGVSFSAKMGEGLSIAVAWTGFSNPSNVPVTRLSPLKIKTASESEYAALYGILNNPPNQTVDGDQNTVVKLEYDDGEYILTFTQLQVGAFPTSGSFSFASYAEEMACDSTSNYRLEAADPLFLSVTDANNNAGASAVYEAEMCQYNTFSSVSLSVNADTVNPAAGTASLRVQWLNFKDNIGFNGDDVMVISPGEDNPGFFTGVDNIVTIFASDKTPAAGITAAASFDSNSGNFVVSVTKSMGATFPASGYFDIFPTRITGIDAQEMPCNTFAMHNVSSADSSNLLLKKSAESLSVEFVWSWCPITFKNAEVEFELDSNGAASVTVSWESLTMASESPLSPELVLTMNNGLFKAQALHLTVNANASYPATAKIVTDGGPMTLSFSTAPGTALPLSGTMVFNLEFIDSLITCASVSTGSITLESSNTDFATIINTNMALLSVDVRTPACPTMTGVTVTQTSTGVRLEWQGYRNDDSLTLKETMVSLRIAPATTTGVVVFEAAKFPETYVLIEENKLTFAAYLTHDNNGLYITFSQTGTQDSFPTSGSVSFDTVLVAKCDIVNAAQKLSPEDTTGLGMYIVDNSNPVVSGAVNFIASTPRCISAFSGVRLTAPYDDDVNNTLAAIEGSVGFRFSWTGFKSDATIFENMVKISYADVATMSSSLIDDAASALAALYNPTGTVNADWAVTAVVADSTITLSFVYIGADATAVFPTAAYVDVEPPRSQQSHSCDASEVFLVAEMDSSSFAPIDGDNDALVSTYVWANCPISFDTMALSAFVDAGKAKLAVSWTGVTVSTFNTASPTLQINLESGTQVYDSEWGPETVVLNSDVRATAKSIAGVITITFSIVNGATMPADADFVFVPKINETAHSCSQTFTGSYIISSANTAIATVSNSIDTTLVATEARAAACPSVSGMSLTLVESTFTVSWTDFENTDNIPMEDFSDYSILFSGSTAAVFNALSGSTAPINVGANVDVAVTFSNAGFHFAFSGTGTNTIPAPGFFSFDAVQSQKCGLASEYTLGVDESNVSGFSGSDLTVSASTEVCPDPAEFRGVSVTSEIDGDNYNAIFTWTGFINKMSVSLKSSFSFASSDGSSDAFNLEAPATVTLTSAGASVAGIATVIVDDGAYIVSFAPTTDSPMPVNGLLTLSLKLSTGATCGVTSHFLLSSGSDSSVILHAASAGSMSASYTSKQCPAVFTGLAIESDEMKLTGNSGFVVSWLTYSNKDKVALTNVFTIERANTSHANPFTGLSITKVQVLNEHYAIVDGVTAGLAYNNATGAITVSFTFSGNAELPTEGSFVVRPTLDSAVACETVSSFALSTNAALVTATSHGAFTADFNMAVCTVVTGVKVTKSSVTTSALTLALSYFTFQQGAAEGKITLTSSIAALYSDNSELPISVTASSHSFTAITITGHIASGVITIPLSDKLPTAEGSLQFSLTLAVTDDCDRSATLVPAKVGTITMDLAAGFSSLETPGLACIYDWRCTGISNGAAAEGLVCSTSDATQFSTTCSNNCGTGTRPLNAPYCSRLNNNAYKATADTAKCATAKPTLTLSCTDNSCPNAMWKCYAAGTTNTAVDCVNNGGYSACASSSGCHTNPSVERIAVCVADSTSTTDIGALCPSLVS